MYIWWSTCDQIIGHSRGVDSPSSTHAEFVKEESQRSEEYQKQDNSDWDGY